MPDWSKWSLTELVLGLVDGSVLPGDALREIKYRQATAVAEEREATVARCENHPEWALCWCAECVREDRAAWKAAIETAKAEEREACLSLVEAADGASPTGEEATGILSAIAAAIRARGQHAS